MSDALQQLLQSPRLWRGRAQGKAWQGLVTGYPRLDEHLPGGGWPRHALTEILLEHYGSGELKLLMPALARLSQGQEAGSNAGWLAWIAPPFQPYPPALAQWGIDLSRVLIVRPRQPDEVLWAAEQALTSGNCAAVLLWSSALDHAASRRLQLAAEQGKSWAVAFRPVQHQRQHSAAALRITLQQGAQGTDIHILKNRGGRPAAVPGVIHDYASLPGS
ncbi:MAG: translesion DNA synthesis-associated protein ImuA [Woeseia sp.]|jgi:cell division inhibitor SulA/protein ImuA